jgi:UDP-glucose 4-epimerase
MRILVTGGAGFIGSNIVDSLIADNHDVAVIDNLSTGKKEYVNKKAKFYKADLLDITAIRKVFKKFDVEYVIHCAAQTDVRKSMDNPFYDAEQNILGSIILLEVMKEFNVKRITYLSSGGAIYNESIKYAEEYSKISPKCPYGLSKLTVEKYLNFYHKTYGFNTKVLRLANVYGPRNKNGVIRLFIDKMKDALPLTVNGGKQVRDFIHVNDVIEAIKITFKYVGVYNVGTGNATSILTLRERMYRAYGIAENPEDIIKDNIKGEAMFSCLDVSKLKGLGWKPKIKLEEGLKLID